MNKKLKNKIDFRPITPESFDAEKAIRFMLDEFGIIGGNVGIQSKTVDGAKKLFKKHKKKMSLIFTNPKKKK